jgi:hypothetical protein
MRMSRRPDTLRMLRSGKHRREHALVEEEPRLELPFNAYQVHGAPLQSLPPQRRQDTCPFPTPARVGRRTLVPEDDDALKAVCEKASCGEGALR